MKVLILCTGNRCRSQMAETLLRNIAPDWTVCSAGINPAKEVHPVAKQVMSEIGLSMSESFPKAVDIYMDESWDYVITVCANAEKTCPAFNGVVKHRCHIGFDDPDAFKGNDEEILKEFRRVRDEIDLKMREFARGVIND